MSQMECFSQNETSSVEEINEKKGSERKDKSIDSKCNTVKDQTLEDIGQECDVVDLMCSHMVIKKEESTKDKAYPGNVDVKESVISVDLQQTEEIKKDVIFFKIEKRGEEKSKVEIRANKSGDKNDTITFDKDDHSDTVFVLELEGPRFGPQMFRGDGEISISEFLKDYEHYMAMQTIGLNDRQMGLCIRNFLTDRARDIYDQIANKEEYNEVKRTLLNKFQTQLMRDKAELKLKHIYQEERESVLAYANRLTTIVKRVMEGKNEMDLQERLRDEFCNRMSVEYRYLVNGHKPETFEDAYQKAELYEHEFEVKREQQEKDTTKVLEAHAAVQSSGKRKSAGPKKIPKRRRRICYRCRQPGHLMKDCMADQVQRKNGHETPPK